MKLQLAGRNITASTERRTITGTIVRYGTVGYTSAGPLTVRAGAFQVPDDLGRVKLTYEHDRSQVLGYLAELREDGADLTATFKIASGPAGDQALTEAAERTRDGLSYDVIDAVVEDGELISARLVAVGQVAFPAYDDGRVSSVAASNPTDRNTMPCTTCGQVHAAGVTACQTVAATASSAPATEPTTATAAAVLPAVPAGVNNHRPGITTSRESALDAFVTAVTAAMAPGGAGARGIEAALADVTHTEHTGAVSREAWSDELWSGLVYTPEWVPLFNTGPLTDWTGRGWRFTQKPEIEDYEGDKAEIPTNTIATEPSDYEAARMAVGHDFDRKFFDFGDTGFLRACLEAVRESWAIQLDGKVRAHALANAVPVAGAASDSVLKAAMRAANAVKTRTRARATWVAVNDGDFETLLDFTRNDVPAFLELFNINPGSFVVDPLVTAGTVLAGVKSAATVRTLPGSPIQVDAQNLANGGIDRAFFGYYAIEEHHTQGIASATYTAPVAGE